MVAALEGPSFRKNKGTLLVGSGSVLDGFEGVLFDGIGVFKKIRPQNINFKEDGLFKKPDWEWAFVHGKRSKKVEIKRKNLLKLNLDLPLFI